MSLFRGARFSSAARGVRFHFFLSVVVAAGFLFLNLPKIIVIQNFGSVVWYPATSFVFAVMLVVSPWYGLLAALCSSLAGILLYHQSWITWSGTLGAASLGGVYAIAAWLLRERIRIDRSLERRRDVARYVAVTSAAALVSALVGSTCLAAEGSIAWIEYWHTALRWTLGDEIGLLGFAPFLLIHVFPRLKNHRAKFIPATREFHRESSPKIASRFATVLEPGLQYTFSLLIAWQMLESTSARFQVLYLCFVPVIWMAMRGGIHRIAVGLPLFNTAVVVGLHYAAPTAHLGFVMCLLMTTISATGLLVGATVSERQRGEEELRSRTAFLQAQLDSTIDGVLVLEDTGNIVLHNRRFVEMFRVPPSLLRERTDHNLKRHVASFMQDPLAVADQVKFLHQNPETMSRDEVELNDGRVLDRYSAPVVGKHGAHYGRIWTFRDITETRRNRDYLAQLSLAVEQSPVSVVITDPAGNITYVNRKFTEITGYEYSEAIGKNPRILKSGETPPEMYTELWRTITAGDEWHGELQNKKRNGELFWEALVITSIRDENGKITHFIGVKEDITKRRAMEIQLRQSQKLESIGQLAAGIAHEINTPTQYVGDNLRFLQETFKELYPVLASRNRVLSKNNEDVTVESALRDLQTVFDGVDTDYLAAEIPKALDEALEGVARVAKVVAAMKEFSHPGSKEKKPADLNHAIESTLTVSRSEWKYVANVQTEFDPSLPPVYCLVAEINQVILNLIVNAAHAISEVIGKGETDKGKITIRTQNNAKWVEIQVEDTGAGIPESIRTRVFDPFFTTKQIGKGTGQGLAIAHSVIVERHQGTIHFETKEGKGTTFFIRLPHEGQSLAATATSL